MAKSPSSHTKPSERRASLRFQDAKGFPLVEGTLEIEGGKFWPVNIDNLSLWLFVFYKSKGYLDK